MPLRAQQEGLQVAQKPLIDSARIGLDKFGIRHPHTRADKGDSVSRHFVEIFVPHRRVSGARKIRAILFRRKVSRANGEERNFIASEKVPGDTQQRTGVQCIRITHPESVLIKLPQPASRAISCGDLVETRWKRLMEWGHNVGDARVRDRHRGGIKHLFIGTESELDLAAGRNAKPFLTRVAKVNRDDWSFARAERGEQSFDAEACSALACINGGLLNERNSVTALPIAGIGIEIERDDAAAAHWTRLMIGDDYRGRNQKSCAIYHVPEPVQPALDSEKSSYVDLRRLGENISRSPREMWISRNGNFVGMAEIDHAGVSVLGSGFDKFSGCLGYRNAQRLPTQDEQITSSVKEALNRLPRVRRNRRTIGKD